MIEEVLISDNARAGDFLKDYEWERYSILERALVSWDVVRSIFVPPDAEEFADVSFWQKGMDWNEYAKHARSAILRIGQGNWKDTEFETNYIEARRAGVALGGYVFYDDRYSPTDHANMVKAAMAGKSFEKEIYVDWEVRYGGPFYDLGNVVALMQLLEAAGIQCHAVGMYTGYYFFIEHSNALEHANQYNYLKTRPLWLAWYAAASFVKVPAPWTDYTDWQYGTPSDPWGQPTKELDRNKSRYTTTEYENKYLGGGTTPPPPQGETMQANILAFINLRPGPGDLSSDVGDLFAGDVIEWDVKQNVTSGSFTGDWYHVLSITRGSQVLTGVNAWCWGYNVQEIAAPPPTDTTITDVRFSGEVVFDFADGTQEVWHVTDMPFIKGPSQP